MTRPITREDIETAYKNLADVAIQLRRDGDELAPQALIFGLDDSGRVPITEFPRNVVLKSFDSDAGKEALGQLIRTLLTEGTPMREMFIRTHGWAPRMTAIVSEAWVVTRSTKAPRDALPPSEQPDRVEVVMISISTPERSYLGRLPIVDGKVVFVPIDIDKYVMTGRLAVHPTIADVPVQH